MSVNPDKIKNRRISSILKKGNDAAEGDNTTETFNRVPKRISFSATKNIKEFKVGESNATIWGQSLEENVFRPPTTNVISLFADTEDNVDDEAMEVEMVHSNQQRQSVIQRSPLKDINQTMFLNETCDITNISKTIFGSAMKFENMTLVGRNKRKSVPNTSVDNSISLSPIEKVRKINEIEMSLTLAPDNIFKNTMVMEIDDNRAQNLDETRIFDADLSTDEMSNDNLSVTNHRINLFLDESLSSKPLNETSTTVTNIIADDHSMTSLLPHSCKPKNANQTRIFGQEDVNAVIDQTVLTRKLLEDHNFSQFSIIKCHSSSSLSNGDEYFGNNASKARDVQNFDTACPSMLTNTDDRAIDQSSIIRNTKRESMFTDDFMCIETRDHCPEQSILYEQQLMSPTLSKIRSKSILTNDYIVNRRREHGSNSLEILEKDCIEIQRSPTSYESTLMKKDVVSEINHHGRDCLKVLHKQACDENQLSPNYNAKSSSTLETQRSPTFHHAESGSTLMKKDVVSEVNHHGRDCLKVLQRQACDDEQLSPNYYAKSSSTLEKQRSPTFHHAKSGSNLMKNDVVSEVNHHGRDCLKVLQRQARDDEQLSPNYYAKSSSTLEKQRSPTFHHAKSGSNLMKNDVVSEVNHHGRDCLKVLQRQARDDEQLSPNYYAKSSSTLEKQRSPTFHHAKSGSNLMKNDVVSEVNHHGRDCLKVLQRQARDDEQLSPNYYAKSSSTLEKQRSPTFHHAISGSKLMKNDVVSEVDHHGRDRLKVLHKQACDENQLSPNYNAKSSSTLENQRSPTFHNTNATSMNNNSFVFESKLCVPDSVEEKQRSDDSVKFPKIREVSKSLLPSLNYAAQNLEAKIMTPEKDNEFQNQGNTSTVPLYQSPNVPRVIDNHQNFSRTTFFDHLINSSQADNQYLTVCDLSFVRSDPLSSTKLNYNNTDELCNLKPEQLRKIDLENTSLDISNDMLSETKPELVDDSKMEESSSTGTEKTEEQMNMQKNIRCRRCSNCRKSIDGNVNFLKIEDLKELQLDFSGYEKFKGLATYRDVIEARKKRREAKDLAKQSLMDQNVPHPGWEILWENKKAEIMLLPQPKYEPMLLTIFPMRMDIEFLLKNKMRSEYTKWKYFDNFFFIGGVALRHEKIPSIRIHIKFDRNGPERAQKLNIPLAFKRVFVEECPYYLKDISARNYLKHKHGLAMLPFNLTTMCSDSERIYKALDQFDEWFESVVAKVNELIHLTIECEAFLKMSGRECYIEKTVFDIKNYLTQKFVIKLDKIDKVGWQNVSFHPDCETTDEFKNLPLGLQFLRTFLGNPKSFVFVMDGGIS